MYSLLTVVMPSLNVIGFYKKCMDSVLSQSFTDMEILCIDAGSDDGTLELIEGYARKDPRIRVIISPEKSYGHQVNMGIEEARGRYIGIVETDDFIETDMYKVLFEIAERTGADVIKCNAWLLKEFSRNCLRYKKGYCPDDYYDRLIGEDSRLIPLHMYDYNLWNGIYRRDFIVDNDIRCSESPGAAYQDIGFIQGVHNYAESFYFDSGALYNYRQDRDEASSYSARCLINACNEFKRVIEGHDGFALKESHLPYVLWKIADSFVGEVNKILKLTEYDRASEYLKEPYDWFCKALQDNDIDRVLENLNVDLNFRVQLKFLMEEPDAYIKYRKINDEIMEQKNIDLKNTIEDKKVIICGSGKRGRALLDRLFIIGADVVAFADNDPSKWQASQEYYPEITGIADAVGRFRDSVFLIANKYHAEEIKQQIIALGVSETRVHEWRP